MLNSKYGQDILKTGLKKSSRK